MQRWFPFFVNNNEERLLPMELLMDMTGSNGMCAGNTKEEALVQGFCEIFERYVARELYYNEITPPDIPLSYFEGTPVYDELLYVKKNSNFEVVVKDCSLQNRFPVIGVLFIDQMNQRYNFKLGADFIPYVALERCLTEILQGGNSIPTLPIKLFSIKGDLKDNQLNESIDYNFQKIIMNHSGYWPISLLSKKSTYEFVGFNNLLGQSDKDDLSYSIDLVKNLGYNIYIRDNSILDFPAYYIVIPGISQINTKKMYEFYKIIFPKIEVKKLYSINFDKAKLLVHLIDNNYCYLSKCFDYKNLYLYNTDTNILELEIELLAFMLFFYLGDMCNAKKYLDLFLKSKKKPMYNYYYAVSDYLNLKYFQALSDEEVKFILQKCYEVSIVEEVISSCLNPGASFENSFFPNCFDCETCFVKKTCSYEYILTIHKKLHDFAKIKQIKQSSLSDII